MLIFFVSVQSESPTNSSAMQPTSIAQIKSVAERIQDFSQSNGFSTKINLNLSNSSPVTVPGNNQNWEETGKF